MDKALIVFKMSDNLYSEIKETENLAKVASISSSMIVTQNIITPNKTYYIGKGKLEEIKTILSTTEIDLVLFNFELSPSQLKNIEKELDIKVIDRNMLILDIFSKRAKTKQAMLEVELAQLKYFLPRLSGMTSFTRQGGGSGSFSAKGPGEKKLELDKRKIYKEIEKIQDDLKKIKSNRMLEKKERISNDIPCIAIVGYTNSGKSSTLNTLLSLSSSSNKKEVLSKDMLFATIDSQVRKITLDDNQEVLLMDTVGFISNLPTELIESFKSTLENILDADLILHVVDVTSEEKELQIETTNNILESLGVDKEKIIYLYNKADLIESDYHMLYTPGFLFSNKENINHKYLLDYIKQKLSQNKIFFQLNIPYEDSFIIDYIKKRAHIILIEKNLDNIKLEFKCSQKFYEKVKKLLKK